MSTSNKAQAHVEIILATTLFIGFLLFLFVFLNSSFKATAEIPTEKIQNKIFDELQEEVGTLLVVVETTDDCYSLAPVESDYGTNFREVQDTSNPRRYTIYYGNFINPSSISCSGKPENYEYGAYKEENIIVESNIADLVNRYNEDYVNLRQELGLGNFEFEFRDSNNERIDEFSVSGKIPDSTNVNSKDFPVRVIDNNAKISSLTLNIRAWK